MKKIWILIIVTMIGVASIFGVILFLYYSGPELTVALRKMDHLNSVTISTSDGTIYLEGDNAKYSLSGMTEFYCHFEKKVTKCYYENGDLITTINNSTLISESDFGLVKFVDLLSYNCSYMTDSKVYFCSTPLSPFGGNMYKVDIFDGYVRNLEISGQSYGTGWTKYHFSNYNETKVDMPDER